MRPLTQPSEPELWYATVAVDRAPGQSVGYPLCPYHEAWKPAMPAATLTGCGMPGPSLLVHVAAALAASATFAGASVNVLATSSAPTSTENERRPIPWMPTRAEARQYADTRSLPVTRPIGLVGTNEERVAPRPGAPSPVRDERVRPAGGVSPGIASRSGAPAPGPEIGLDRESDRERGGVPAATLGHR